MENQKQDHPAKSNKNMMIAVAVIAIVGLAIVGFMITKSKEDADDVLPPPVSSTSDNIMANESTTSTETPAASPAVAGTYKDGSYDAQGDYQSPVGSESVSVKLTVKDGMVTDVAVTGGAESGESKMYQSRFISGVKEAVVGKKLDGLKLDRVAGSSLTPKGFNDAVAKIQTQAKSQS